MSNPSPDSDSDPFPDDFLESSAPAPTDDEVMAAQVIALRDQTQDRASVLDAALWEASGGVGGEIGGVVREITLRARRHIREQGLDDTDAEVYMSAIQKGLRHGVMRAISFLERDLGPQPWERVDWP